MIIKYVLNSDGTIPDYVEDGGYFADPSDASGSLIGIAVSSGVPSDAPATTSIISKTDLIARVQDTMSANNRREDPAVVGEDVSLRPQLPTATETVDAWCLAVGEP